VTDGGGVDESVLAYSNGTGPTRSLVIYHTRFGSTAGTIRESAAYARRSASGAKRMVRRSLADGLGLSNDPLTFVTFRDARTGLEYIRSSHEVRERGLWLALDAYQGHVFWEFDEVRDGTAGQWRRLAERLGGAGVPSLEAALVEHQLEPVHEGLRAIFEGGHVAAILSGTAGDVDLDALEAALAGMLAAVAAATGVEGDPVATATRWRLSTAPRCWAMWCSPVSGHSRRARTWPPRATPGMTSCGSHRRWKSVFGLPASAKPRRDLRP